MPFARRISILPLLPALLVAAAAVAEERAGPDDAALGAWQGPAAAAAAAAQPKPPVPAAPVAAPAAVPLLAPAPSPAERPQSREAEAAPAAPAMVKAVETAPPVAAPIPATATPPVKEAPKDSAAAPAKEPAKDTKTDPKKDAKEKKKPVITARQLFGSVKTPAPLAARSLGWYAKGCLAGAKGLAIDGPAWQVMRLSRNRMWGHPNLIALIERLGKESKAAGEWPGLLVGDISQPRGGPMISGHASHQVGLDVDIWLTPMPDRTLTKREREDISATSMLAADEISVNPKVWGDGQVRLIKRAASYSAVERVLVHPAIKKALCEAAGTDRGWLSKVRPYFGHYYHFHVRIGCPAGQSNCKPQPPVPGGDGCGAELKDWIKKVTPKKPPVVAEKPAKPKKQGPVRPDITLADLPAECKAVLMAGGNVPPTEPANLVDNSKDAAPDTVADAPDDPAAKTAAKQ